MDGYNQHITREDDDIIQEQQITGGASESEIEGISPSEATQRPQPTLRDQPETGIESQDFYSEMQAWRSIPDKEQREIKKNEWYMKYYGRVPKGGFWDLGVGQGLFGTELFDYSKSPPGSGFYPGSNRPIQTIRDTQQTLAAPGLGTIDFATDLIGLLPGMSPVDDWWDERTFLDNPGAQGLRNFSNIVIPSMIGGSLVQGSVAGLTHLTKFQKFATAVGLNTITDAAIVGLSDQGEEKNITRALADNLPGWFGEDGTFSFVNWLATKDGDSLAVRRLKNSLEDIPLSIFGNIIGSWMHLKGASKGQQMGWFEPLDDKATTYKRRQILSISESDDIIEMKRLQDKLDSGEVSGDEFAETLDDLIRLEERTGKLQDIEDAFRIDERSITSETDAAAENIIRNNNGEVPSEFNKDIVPDASSSGRQSKPIGNVARNQADIAAIENGAKGDPAPIVTPSTMKGVGTNDPTRKIVMKIDQLGRQAGRFEAAIEGMRIGRDEMKLAAWKSFARIIDPSSSIDDIRALFSNNADIKTILGGKVQLEYISDADFEAAVRALDVLNQQFIGEGINEASARTLQTLGFELRSISDGFYQFEGIVNQQEYWNRAIDKTLFILDELDLNKSISGKLLKQKDVSTFLSETPLENLEEVVKSITDDFSATATAIHQKNLRYTNTLRKLIDTNPTLIKPLAAAFSHTDGNVDTIGKLMRWSAEQITPMGALKSPNPREVNLFARGLYGVVFSNMLSAGSVVSATVGGSVQMIAKPMKGLAGAFIWGTMKGTLIDDMRRAVYVYQSQATTTRKSITMAWDRMRAVWSDPTANLDQFRKDIITTYDRKWEAVSAMRPFYEESDNVARLWQLNAAENMRDIANMKWARYPMTGMVMPDTVANIQMTHISARLNAYEDVMAEFGWLDPKQLEIAERQLYASMWDGRGLPTDKFAKAMAGDINFTTEDGWTSFINKAVTAFPIMRIAFWYPRSESNAIKNALSYTPIAAIPGMNKFSKTIYAQSQEDIAQALAEHGIDMASERNAIAMFETLRAEYIGGLAIAGGITKLLWGYAMDGNCIGNGDPNPSINKIQRDNLRTNQKSCRVPGTDQWVSFRGIPLIDPILTMMSDLAMYSKDLDGAVTEDTLGKVTAILASTIFSGGPLQGTDFLVRLLKREESGIEWFQKSLAKLALPVELNQIAKQIDGAAKNVEDGLHDFILSRLPVASFIVEPELDLYTGLPYNRQTNGWLNALSNIGGVVVAEGDQQDPGKPFEVRMGDKVLTVTWREFLRDIAQYDGGRLLSKDSSGTVEWTSTQKRLILRQLATQEMWKDIYKIVRDPYYHKDLAQLFEIRRNQRFDDDYLIELKKKELPLFKELDFIIKNHLKQAEQALLAKSEHNVIFDVIRDQNLADYEMGQGNVPGAQQIREESEVTKQELLNYGGSR